MEPSATSKDNISDFQGSLRSFDPKRDPSCHSHNQIGTDYLAVGYRQISDDPAHR